MERIPAAQLAAVRQTPGYLMSPHDTNPIGKPILDIFARLTALNGFLNLLDNQLDNFRKSFRRAFDDQGFDISHAYAGFALLIRDLTVPQDQKFLSYVPGGTFTRRGEDYLAAADELVTHWSHWSVAQCYETLEAFLRDIAAYYYHSINPDALIGNLRYAPIDTGEIDAWRSMFRQREWNSFSLLNQLRASAPEIHEFESRNILQVDISEWHSLLATVRHSVTHSSSRITRSQLKTSVEAIEQLLPTAFPGTWDGDSYVLGLSKKSADDVIHLTGDYAFLIFKSLSTKEGYDWRVVEPYNE